MCVVQQMYRFIYSLIRPRCLDSRFGAEIFHAFCWKTSSSNLHKLQVECIMLPELSFAAQVFWLVQIDEFMFISAHDI